MVYYMIIKYLKENKLNIFILVFTFLFIVILSSLQFTGFKFLNDDIIDKHTTDFIDETPDATVKISERNNNIKAQIIRNNNVDRFIFKSPNRSSKNLYNVGDEEELSKQTGKYEIIAIINNNEYTLKTKTI